VGKEKSGLFEPGVKEYASRLAHYTKFELLELPASDKKKEGALILKSVKPREQLVALDERGKQLTTEAFAHLLERALNRSQDLAFVVGGDDGLSDEVKKTASFVLSLSSMTLPHRLARLVLVEQIYRAFTLLRGEPYHRP
jgi:23S rRNA (pseudouridine1915-N3)-methyltransferase